MGRIVCEFKDGALTLRSRIKTRRFCWEPSPLAEELDAGGRWIEAWPSLRLFSPKSGGPEAVAAFRRTLPADLVAAVEGFPRNQWGPIALLGAEAYARDLAKTCPVLVFCIANSHIFRGGTPATAASVARRHCRQPRREIAGWLGFPVADSTVNVLARIRPEAVSPEALLALRSALLKKPGLAKLLMHLPSINAGVLFFTSRWRLDGLPTYALLAGIAEDPDELETAPTGSLLIDALRLMAEIDPQRRAPGFRSADRIRRFHEAIVREHREMLARREREKAAEVRRQIQRSLAEDRRLASQGRGPTDLPRPPVAGTATIVPLAAVRDLDQESAQQSNCAATMAGDVRAGRYYLYRVLFPSRATVALAMGPDARWRVEQIRGPRNSEAPPETRRAVEHWLDRAQRSL